MTVIDTPVVHECEEKKARGERATDFEISRWQGKWYLIANGHSGSVEIQFCPFCGDDLREGP